MADGGDIDRLYSLDPDEFIVARDATVRRLRAAKKREAAAEIASLRRPTVAAAAVNALIRDGAGPELRAVAEALESAVTAGDAAALRQATADERALLDRLTRQAGDGRELAPAVLVRVRETLHAAVVDGDVRDEVLSGRLEKEQEAAGFGGLVPSAPVVRERPPPKKARQPRPEPEAPAPTAKPDAAERRAAVEGAREARDAARAARTSAQGALKQARKEQEAAEASARRSRSALAAAREARDEAAAELAAWEAALDHATSDVGDAEVELEQAAAASARAEAALDEAAARLHEAETALLRARDRD